VAKGKISLNTSVELDVEDVLAEVDTADIVEHFKEANSLEDLMDAIGKEACAEHFDLVEKGSETET